MSNIRSFRRRLKKSPLIRAKQIAAILKTKLIDKAENQILFGYNPSLWNFSNPNLCLTKKSTQEQKDK